jgi:hypothetical protein
MNVTFHRIDRYAPTVASRPPTTGKYRAFIERPFRNTPIISARLTPKHRPGKRVGSKTPNDIPTNDAINERSHNTTTARSKPTGTKKGSRKT